MPKPSPTRDRILRTLLYSAAKNVPGPAQALRPLPSLYQLADRTGASFAWVHETVTGWIQKGWVETHGQLEVLDPVALYEWWGKHRTTPEVHSFHASDPQEAIADLRTEHGVASVITSYYAENAYQGHLFPRRMDAYIRETDLPHAREGLVELGAQLGGTNLRLLTGDDAIVDEAVVVGEEQAPTVETRYAPLPQVVLDLITEGGSAREAADLLIERAYPHANASLS